MKNVEHIGLNRFYETMAFHANPLDTRFLDADNMHEAVVEELTQRLLNGEFESVLSDQPV